MAFTIGVPRETQQGETRVALIPSVAERMRTTLDGAQAPAEEGAGAQAPHDDAAYDAAGW